MPAATTTTARTDSPVFLRKAPGRVRGRRCFRSTAVLKYIVPQALATRKRTLKSISHSARPSPHLAIRFGPAHQICSPCPLPPPFTYEQHRVCLRPVHAHPYLPPHQSLFLFIPFLCSNKPCRGIPKWAYTPHATNRQPSASAGIRTPWSDILLHRPFLQAEPAAVNTVKSAFSSPCRPLYQFV